MTERLQNAGRSPGIPLAGEKFFIQLARQEMVELTVERSSSSEMVVRALNGAWELSQWEDSDGPKSLEGPSQMQSTYWVVRAGK